MGTRNLVAVYANKEYRIAQYGQWDGYPSGQGLVVLKFLKRMNREKFTQKALAAQWVNEEDLKNMWVECGADPGSEFVNVAVDKTFSEKYPQLHRDTGGKILSIVSNSKPGIKLHNGIEFASNSLFCEWAYVIDLDKGTFEVYRGFNKRPLGKRQRFYCFEDLPKPGTVFQQYHPIRLAAQWKLDDLPTKKQFMEKLNQK